jgi:GrpB-like predicted nucleotidyltransferase (UPF0157 family)
MSPNNIEYNPQNDPIYLEEYNPIWPEQAVQEMAIIKKVLSAKPVEDIQHIGSTAIPGLAAKPIIDIYLGVKELSSVDQETIDLLTSLNYVFWRDNPDKEKMFFVKGMPPYGEKRTHHVHIVEYAADYWRAALAFRDYMRQHPEEVSHYQKLKYELMRQYTYDREAYTNSKTDYIRSILHKAGFKGKFLPR